MTKEKLKALENDNRLYITDKTIREKYYLKERKEIGKQIDNFWHDIGNLNRVSDVAFIDGQKTEKLMQRIISLAYKEDDIVLDFHLGSGTSAAAAHKMGRRYIGIEQMDYINEIT
ncbi:DNA methyltransferase, partial [Escherichia coli]|uniref:DNA methyltransferase n=1 Tax=Escherichia coli TaxID=562 RepID=UPI0034D96C13